jgi:hypothetical protein
MVLYTFQECMASSANSTLFTVMFLITSRAPISSMFLSTFTECMAGTANIPILSFSSRAQTGSVFLFPFIECMASTTLSFTSRAQTGSVFLVTTFTSTFTIVLSITWLSNPTMRRWSSTLPGLLQNGPILLVVDQLCCHCHNNRRGATRADIFTRIDFWNKTNNKYKYKYEH